MIIHEVEQGSLEWNILRAGKVTASDFGNIVTPKFKPRDGDMVKTYLAEKVAEAWLGGPLPSFSSFATEQGSILESESIPWFELQYDCAVKRVGFISDDDNRYGCSPDGIIDGKVGLEVKCPQPPNHVKYLLCGQVPDIYLPQIHFSLFVTGFQQWRFLSYRRHMPPLVLTIERNEEYQEVISEALDLFSQKFDEAMERMTEINGGPPPRFKPLTPTPPKPKPTNPQPRPDAKPEFVLHRDEVVP